MQNQSPLFARTLAVFFLTAFLLPSTLLAQSVPQIYWIDESGTSIKRANPDGSEEETFIKDLYYAESIAIDPVEQRIYWCDEGPEETFKQGGIYPISSVALDGSGQIESLPVDFAYCDQDILLDDAGHIYFSGSSEEFDVDQNTFINAYSRTDLNGKNEQLILYDNFEYIYGLAGSHIYFGGKLNQRINLDTGKIEDVLPELEVLGDVVDDRQQKRMYFNTRFNIFHSNYDGSDLVSILDVDGVYNLEIDDRGREIYWDSEALINKANLEGKDVKTIIEDYPIDLAFYNPPAVPPVITSTPITEVTLGQTYTYEVNATGTPAPSFSLDNAPAGMQIDATSGVLSWTPSEPGFASVTVRASNGVNPDDTQSFRITVSGTAPIITSTPETSVLLGETYTYDVEATGNPTPTFTLTNAPNGMQINAITGVISWTPSTLGSVEVSVSASNGVAPDATQSFTIEVTGTAPEITSTAVTSVMLGEVYTYDVDATGNPTPTYALGNAPSGMQINATTGVISWTPITLGSTDVVVIASNGVTPDATQSFTVNVIGTATTITSEPVTSVMLGETYAYDVEATGNPPPVFELDTAPEGMQINPTTGEITWATTELGSFEVTVRAANGVQPDAIQSFTIEVTGTAPAITSTAVTTVMLGETYTYVVEATGNPDPTFALTTAPDGMAIDEATGDIIWTPTALGSADVVVIATNGVAPDATQSFTIEVNGAEPAITSQPVTAVMLGETYSYDVEATGNPAPTFALDTAPEGMQINAETGEISWATTELGSFDVTVRAANGVQPDATQSFTIEVNGTGPAITSTAVTAVMLGESYTYDVEATGNPVPVFALTTAPEGMVIDEATGVISWTPVALGSAEVVVTASNGVAPDATQSFTIEVNGAEPTITSQPVTSIMLGETYTYDVDAMGNPTPTFALDTAPEGMVIDEATGEITWVTTELGSFDVTVRASNGVQPDATQSFTIEVIGTAPTITSTAVTTVMLGESYTYDVEATGNPVPTFALTTAPDGMQIDAASGVITWTPGALGTAEVVVAASNGVSPDASQAFTLTVVGAEPTITSDAVTTIMLGESYTYDVEATGNPAPTFALDTAPEGMAIDETTGIISWTPAALGEFDVVVIASNGVSPDASQSFTITVAGAEPTMTSSPITSGIVGETYTYDVEATGNPIPTYALTESPENMTINAETGLIEWTPTTEGEFNVIVTASNGVSPAATQVFTINVVQLIAPAITSTPELVATTGMLYEYTVEATGSPEPALALTEGPEDMTLDPETGLISWTPVQDGEFSVTITATNGVEPDAVQSFTITVMLASNTNVEESLVSEFQLNQNFPNPFASSTTIVYNLPSPDHVNLNVYDMLGRHVKALVDSQQAPGSHQIEWDGYDQQGSALPAGVYFVRIQTLSGAQEVLTMTKVD